MTRLIFLSLSMIFFSSQAQSKDCKVFDYQGVVRLDKKMELVINETTLSEIRFDVPTTGQTKMAPFVNLTVKGQLTLKDSKIGKILKAEYGKADPLNHQKNSYLTPTKEACP